MVGTTKAISTRFAKGGIADRMIWFNGFPFLDTKEEHAFNVPVSHVMAQSHSLSLLPSTGLSLRSLDTLLAKSPYQGFPVVDNKESKILLGYIGRTELRYAIDRTKREGFVSPNAKCLFVQHDAEAITPAATVTTPAVTFEDIASSAGIQIVDFSRFVDLTPLSVHPRLPLETVMELFKKMGPRVVLIDYRGKLMGLVTVKDCLKYQFKVEAGGSSHHGGNGLGGNTASDVSRTEGAADASSPLSHHDRLEERLWSTIRNTGLWVGDRIHRFSKGRIELRNHGRGEGSVGLLEGDEELIDPRDRREPLEGSMGILDGTEDGDNDELVEEEREEEEEEEDRGRYRRDRHRDPGGMELDDR